MKLFNKFTAALMVLPLMAGLTACSDEHAEYSAAEKLTNAQVYFPTTNPTKVELEQDATSYDVTLARVKTDGELVVALTAEQEGDVFQVPSAVTFADGQSTTTVTVTYDPAKLEYDVYQTLAISLADVDITTPYGTSKYVAEYGIPAPWTPWFATKAQWVKAGNDPEAWPLSETESTCTYTYTQIFSGDDPGLPIYYRQSTVDDTQAQIRVDNWGYGVSLILNFNPQTNNIQIEPQYTGYTDSGVGDFYITDVTHWQNKDYYAQFPCKLDRTTGTIVLSTAWMAGENHSACYGYGEEYIQLDGFYIPDYSVELNYVGVLTDKKEATFACADLTLGADVEKAYAMVVTQDDDPAAVADALAAGEGIEVQAGRIEVPFDAEELASNTLALIVAVPGEEGAEDFGVAKFEYYGGGNANPWKSIGTGLYNEGIVSDMYGVEPEYYEVDIQENKDKPGLYRVMNPYGEAWSLYQYNALTPCEYLEVNACDPQAVYILPQMLGIGLYLESGVEPELGFASYAGYFLSSGKYTIDELKGYGVTGIVKDGSILLPTFASGEDETADDYYTYQGIVYYGKDAYYGGNGVEILLPSAVSKAKLKAARSTYNRTMQRLRRSARATRVNRQLNNKRHLSLPAACHKLQVVTLK